jgi:hypothetical protein
VRCDWCDGRLETEKKEEPKMRGGRYVFYIDTGTLPGEKAYEYLKTMREKIKEQEFFSEDDKVLYVRANRTELCMLQEPITDSRLLKD